MIGPVPLVINVPIKEPEFTRALEAREQRRAGFGDRGMTPTLHELMLDRGGEMCDRLITERGWSEADFRHAASRFEETGDPDLRVLAAHLRAMEMFASEKEMEQMQNAQESMTKQLIAGQSEEYLREQRVPVDRPAAPDQHPRRRGWMNYPTNVRPVAEPDVDSDRAARGAMQPPMSQALRSFARLARIAGGDDLGRAFALPLLHAHPIQLGGPLQQPTPLAQDGDSLDSYDDWPKSDAQSDDAIQDQADTARDAALQLGEDIPHLLPGKRVGEDQAAPENIRDEPRGLRRNRADDDVMQRLRRGAVPFNAGQPRGDDRYGHRVRYSGLKRESMRESRDLTGQLVEDMRLHWYGSHSFF